MQIKIDLFLLFIPDRRMYGLLIITRKNIIGSLYLFRST
jgi:hypothetical protein